jgi:hypothetical protein
VYRKIQLAGKGVQVCCHYREVDLVMESLNPHGLFLTLSQVPNQIAAEKILAELCKWCLSYPKSR